MPRTRIILATCLARGDSGKISSEWRALGEKIAGARLLDAEIIAHGSVTGDQLNAVSWVADAPISLDKLAAIVGQAGDSRYEATLVAVLDPPPCETADLAVADLPALFSDLVDWLSDFADAERASRGLRRYFVDRRFLSTDPDRLVSLLETADAPTPPPQSRLELRRPVLPANSGLPIPAFALQLAAAFRQPKPDQEQRIGEALRQGIGECRMLAYTLEAAAKLAAPDENAAVPTLEALEVGDWIARAAAAVEKLKAARTRTDLALADLGRARQETSNAYSLALRHANTALRLAPVDPTAARRTSRPIDRLRRLAGQTTETLSASARQAARRLYLPQIARDLTSLRARPIKEWPTMMRSRIARLIRQSRRPAPALLQPGMQPAKVRRATGIRFAKFACPAPLDPASESFDLATCRSEVLRHFGFTRIAEPEISIVIPVCDKIAYTLNCLRAVGRTAGSLPIEIILADDGSSDETPDFLSQLSGIVYLRNETPQGFIAACNRGAAAARGNYLCFLNNDTVAWPDWLAELRQTFDTVPDAGAVGAMLLFADGSLQEAGGIIWEDGSGWNFGRGDDPFRPIYNYRREVDYVSGACMMIPRALFDSLGGFDRHFAPAYYEDTDLAFRLRRAGKRVIYQPLAKVTHFEGVTAGQDINAGAKSWQAVNRTKFFDRWRETLRSHGVPGQNPELAMDRSQRPVAFVIDATTPTPDRDSGSNDTVGAIEILAAFGFRVVFLPEDNFNHHPYYSGALQRLGVECVYRPYFNRVDQYLAAAVRKPSLAIVNRFGIAERCIDGVRKYAPQAPIILNTVDLHYIRESREAELSGSLQRRAKAAKTKQRELAIAARADRTLVLSEFELGTLRREAPEARASLMPFVRRIPGRLADYRNRHDLIFIGGFRHPPNVDAVEFLLNEIWPLISAELPRCRLHLVGSDLPERFEKFVGHTVLAHGYVKDVRPLFELSRLSLAPLRYGAGIKGKIATSLGYGVPVIATPVAAEGMGFSADEGVAVCEMGARSFADHTLALYGNPVLWEHHSTAGLSAVERQFGFAAGKERWRRLLDDLNIATLG